MGILYISVNLAMNWYKQTKQEWSWKAFLVSALAPPVLLMASLLGLNNWDVKHLFEKHNGDVAALKGELEQQINSTKQVNIESPVRESPEQVNTEPPVPETNFNSNLRDMIARHEGSSSRMYRDSENIPTVGIGFNLERRDARDILRRVSANYDAVLSGQESLSAEQIDALFEINLNEAIRYAEQQVPNLQQLPQTVQEIVIDMMFNLGPTRFSKFVKFKQALARGDYQRAADEMVDSQWYGQVGDRAEELVGMMRSVQ